MTHPDLRAILRIERTIMLDLDGATMRRINAHIDRVDADEPGLGRDPDESEAEAVSIAVKALLDRGLTESETDAGLIGSMLTGEMRDYPRPLLGARLRRAWRALKVGE